MSGFNWVLIVITIVLALLSVGVALHMLVSYQHPEDKNQAWFPKLVVSCLLVTLSWFLLQPSQNRELYGTGSHRHHAGHLDSAAVPAGYCQPKLLQP